MYQTSISLFENAQTAEMFCFILQPMVRLIKLELHCISLQNAFRGQLSNYSSIFSDFFIETVCTGSKTSKVVDLVNKLTQLFLPANCNVFDIHVDLKKLQVAQVSAFRTLCLLFF